MPGICYSVILQYFFAILLLLPPNLQFKSIGSDQNDSIRLNQIHNMFRLLNKYLPIYRVYVLLFQKLFFFSFFCCFLFFRSISIEQIMLWACFIRNMIIWLHSFAWNFVTYALRHFAAISFCFLANSVDVWVCAGVFAFSLITFFSHFFLFVFIIVVGIFVYTFKINPKIPYCSEENKKQQKITTTMDGWFR